MTNGYKKPNLKSLYFDDEVQKISSLQGKTIAITGTTTGIGFVAARTVANKGARAVLLNRKSERSKSSYHQLKKENPGANIVNIELALHNDWVEEYGKNLLNEYKFNYKRINFKQIAEASRK